MQDTAGEAGMYSYGPPHMAGQKHDDQHEHTFSRYVRIRDVALKTCQRRWTVGKSGERGSGISVLVARQDDDDYYYLLLESFSCQHQLMVFHCSLSNSKFPQVFWTLLSIRAILSNVVVWIISTHSLISKSSSPFNNPLVTVSKSPITIGIIVTFIFHSFFNSRLRIEGQGTFFTQFQFYSVVNRDRKVNNSSSSFFIILMCVLLAEILSWSSRRPTRV